MSNNGNMDIDNNGNNINNNIQEEEMNDFNFLDQSNHIKVIKPIKDEEMKDNNNNYDHECEMCGA